MRGGKRKSAGRKLGGINKQTLLGRDWIEKAKAAGVTPLDFMLEIMRDPEIDPKRAPEGRDSRGALFSIRGLAQLRSRMTPM
jgi:hypothetical protein